MLTRFLLEVYVRLRIMNDFFQRWNFFQSERYILNEKFFECMRREVVVWKFCFFLKVRQSQTVVFR